MVRLVQWYEFLANFEAGHFGTAKLGEAFCKRFNINDRRLRSETNRIQAVGLIFSKYIKIGFREE